VMRPGSECFSPYNGPGGRLAQLSASVVLALVAVVMRFGRAGRADRRPLTRPECRCWANCSTWTRPTQWRRSSDGGRQWGAIFRIFLPGGDLVIVSGADLVEQIPADR